MRRFLAAVLAATFALSPVAILGVTSGMQAAHADLGWCDECEIARPIGGLTPIAPPSLGALTPATFGTQP